jgi:hypothetical protein
MKLSKIYSLKKSKSDEIISFKFPFIDIRYQKRLPDSASRQLPDSASRWIATPRLGDSGSRWEKKDSIEIVFSHTKVVFSPPKFAKKDDFFAQKHPLNLSSVLLKSLDP